MPLKLGQSYDLTFSYMTGTAADTKMTMPEYVTQTITLVEDVLPEPEPEPQPEPEKPDPTTLPERPVVPPSDDGALYRLGATGLILLAALGF